MKRIVQHLRILPLILLGGGVFAFPLPAQAFSLFSIEGIAASVVGTLVNLFAYIVGFVGGLVLALFGWLVNIMMAMNIQVFDAQNTLVHVGWNIMRDLANLGFVLIIIIIALGVMFRIEKYGSQKLLVRLIAAAILVNFSLAIAGVFIQFSNVLTTFFLNRIPSPAGLGSALMGAFNPQRFSDPQNFSTTAEALSTFGAELFALIAQTVFPVIFVFISIIVVATFAIMLFVRYLHLTFLGVVAPIVWLFWVIPGLGDYFNKWWNDFIKWTFFAPAATFFIYLAFAALDAMGKEPAFIVGGSNFFSAGLATIMSQGIQAFVICGLMLGGLIVAQKFGVESANIGMSLANKAKAGTLAWAGRGVKRGGARALESKLGTGVAKTLQRIPGLKRVGMALGGQADILRRGLVEDADKRIKKYSDKHLAENLDTLSPQEYVAATERLAKNDTVGLIKDRSGNGNVLGNVTEENKKLFAKYYGENPRQWKAFEVGAGMNVATANEIRNGNVTQLRSEMKEWIKGLKAEQIAKLPTNDIFNGVDENGNAKDLSNMGLPAGDRAIAQAYRVAVVNGVAQNIPSDIARLFKNVKGAGFEQLHDTTQYVHDFIEPVDPQRAEKILDVLNRIASVRLYDTGAPATPTAPAATPPPPPPPRTP